VYQRQLSVPSFRGRLVSTSESWGENGHTTRCTGPVSVVLRLRLVSGWGLRKRRSAPPQARERTLLTSVTDNNCVTRTSRRRLSAFLKLPHGISLTTNVESSCMPRLTEAWRGSLHSISFLSYKYDITKPVFWSTVLCRPYRLIVSESELSALFSIESR